MKLPDISVWNKSSDYIFFEQNDNIYIIGRPDNYKKFCLYFMVSSIVLIQVRKTSSLLNVLSLWSFIVSK